MPTYLESLPEKLAAFEKFLGDRSFFAGSELTFPDFHMYELLDQHRELKADCLESFPKLSAFMKRFEV